MRILMAVPMYPFPVAGGLERQAHELAKSLVKRGHDVRALSGLFDPAQRATETIDGVRVHRVPWVAFRPMRFLLFPFGLASALLGLRRDVDLVHVHNVSWFGGFVTLLAKALGLPVISKLPGVGQSGIPGMRSSRFGALRIALFKWSDVIIAMTPESLTELEGIGYPRTRVLKVLNGVSLLPATPRMVETAPSVDVVYVGRLSAEKGLSELFHAWADVKARASRPVRLRVIGDGPLAEDLRALTRALDIGDAVEFSGFSSNVAAELRKAQLFVLASPAEGNSNAILEAMSAGLPIVATRVGGAANQVGPEGEGFLVPPGDRVALSTALLDLIEDDALRRQLGAAMRTRVERVFDIDRIAAIYERAYELVVSGCRQEVGKLNGPPLRGDEAGEDACAG